MGYNRNKELIKPSQPLVPNHGISNGNDNQNHQKTGSENLDDRKNLVAARSSRWNPTPEQLLALEELYRLGTRTPTTEQIQQIASKLRKFGKIEGKNVFYWFQNHKARERQKRRRDEGEANVLEVQRNVVMENSHVQKDLSVLRRTGNHRAEQTKSGPPSALTEELIPVNENGTREESERSSEDAHNATWQSPIIPRSASSLVSPSTTTQHYHLITSRSSPVTPEADQNIGNLYNLDGEEETREIRTLDLFPVSENREKPGTERETSPTGFTMMTKPNRCCYFYEFIPLKN